MESIHRQVVNCNSYAKVPSAFQRTAVQQSHLILNGRFYIVSTNFDRWLVDCNSNAKDFTSFQHSAIKQSQIFLKGKVWT